MDSLKKQKTLHKNAYTMTVTICKYERNCTFSITSH